MAQSGSKGEQYSQTPSTPLPWSPDQKQKTPLPLPTVESEVSDGAGLCLFPLPSFLPLVNWAFAILAVSSALILARSSFFNLPSLSVSYFLVYLDTCRNWATCELLRTMGNCEVHPDARLIAEVHDEATRAQSRLALA
jgi:hypothetical protein